jgi:predicted MPP superfamily phosphohydrolase
MRKIATISFFLLVVAGFLYLGNFVIYEAAALAFGITTFAQLLSLGIGLGLLSASFIVATIIGNFRYNRFTRMYYLVSSVWIGLFAYLFFASVLYIICSAISPSFLGIGSVLFLIAILISAYGIVHARKILITKIPLTLPNLPSSWKNKKAIWISDLHLGQIHGVKFAEKIVTKISALSPDIIFIGGDLYDGTGAPDIAELTAPFKKLRAPLGVYFITGNHEEYGNQKRFISAVESVGIRVLQDEIIEIDGLQLVGVDYKNASDAVRFKKILSDMQINPEKASILLKHEPRDVDIADAAGISLQISGHTHNAQLWPLNYIAELTYKKYAYGLKRFKNMQVYTSSGTGTWGPPLRVGTDSEIVLFIFI